ncbi:MAG: NAD(P)-binding domain-containing protein [Burkholderiales bacterium]|nr:NAD(P)-binding domain-containing protein [Burkholderiales bacterium]
MTTIGFVGTGRIAAALVAGLCSLSGSPKRICVGPRNADTAADLARRFKQVTVANDNQGAVNESDWVVLALRPQVARAVIPTLEFSPGQRVLSLIAPVDDAWMEAAIAPGRLAARIFVMPSVESRIGPILLLPRDEEVAALLEGLGTQITARDRREFLALWSVTALIAPYYGFLASSAQWATANGVRADTATAFAAASFHALGAIADRPGAASPIALAQHAQTPGGLNEQAVTELTGGNWFGAVGSALDGILKRLEGKR